MKKRLLMSGFGLLVLVAPLHAQEMIPSCALPSRLNQVAFVAPVSEQQEAIAAAQLKEVDEFPKAVKKVDPVYPALARKAGIEGTVYVQLSVDTAGKVSEAKVVKSENEVLNEASIQAARQWTFTPAMKDGKKIAIALTVPFRFKLAEGKDDKAGSDKVGYMLLHYVHGLLNGDSLSAIRHRSMDEAYLIDGNMQVNLIEAVEGKSKTNVFSSERARSVGNMRININDEGNSAIVVAMTEGPNKSAARWHTVVWVKTKGGEWKIQHWHTSH